jgi:hypothetical protein
LNVHLVDQDTGQIIDYTWIELFRLEELRLPEFRLQLEFTANSMGRSYPLLGDDFTIGIRAAYLSGDPLVDAIVELNASYQALPDPDQDQKHTTSNESKQPIRHAVQLRTDDQGKAVWHGRIPSVPRNDWYVGIEASVSDSMRRMESDTIYTIARRRPLLAKVKPGRNFITAGDTLAIAVQVVDSSNRPVAEQGTLTVIREQHVEAWISPEGEILSGTSLASVKMGNVAFPPIMPLHHRRWELVNTTVIEETVCEIPLSLDDTGDASVRVELATPGRYRIEWHGRHSKEVTRTINVLPADDDSAADWFVDLNNRCELIVERQEIIAGETARALLLMPVNTAHGILFSSSLSGFTTRDLSTNRPYTIIELPTASRQRGILNVHALLWGAYKQWWAHAIFNIVPEHDEHLLVSLSGIERVATPGATAEVEVSVRDGNGENVCAELGLLAFDGALLAFERNTELAISNWLQPPYVSSYVFADYDHDNSPIMLPPEGPARHPVLIMPMDKLSYEETTYEYNSEFVEGRLLGFARLMFKSDLDSEITKNELPDSDLSQILRPRADFSWTALWAPDLETDADGRASATFTYPDSVTAWEFRALAVDKAMRVGLGTARTVTRLPFFARLNAPRFLVAGDQATVTALLRNDSGADLQATVRLDATGGDLLAPAAQTLAVPSGGEARVEWRLQAPAAGAARLTLSAHAGAHADALVRTLPVHPAGRPASDFRAGSVSGGTASTTFTLPAGHAGEPQLTLSLTPSLASSLAPALPGLVAFPYNCNEQALSRILAATVLEKSLHARGIGLAGLLDEPAAQVAGSIGLDKAQVTDFASLRRAIIDRLLQTEAAGAGGWPWFSGGPADPFISAYLYWGLSIMGIENDFADARQRLDAARGYLVQQAQDRAMPADRRAFLLHALCQRPLPDSAARQSLVSVGAELAAAPDQLSPGGVALLALAAKRLDAAATAERALRLLLDRVREPDTTTVDPDRPAIAYWGDASGRCWQWLERAEPATALALLALGELAPDHHLIEPAQRWLLQRRHDAGWRNTLDTTFALIALAGRMQLEQGAVGGGGIVRVNGIEAHRFQFNAADYRQAGAPVVLPLPAGGAADAPLLVEIGADAGTTVHWQAALRWFDTARPVAPGRHIAGIDRAVEALHSRPTLLAGPRIERVVVASGGAVGSGTSLEVVLRVEAPVDLEYVIIEAPKPAGVEHLAQLSGKGVHAAWADPAAAADAPRWARTVWGYDEWRDNRAVFFFDRLPAGVWEIRYPARAESPGSYWTAPARIEAMYAPEISAHSEDLALAIDR